MLFYKIYLMNAYDTEDEIGNRPLIRCFQKSGVSCFIEDCNPFLLVYVDEGLFIRELFTREFLRKSNICNKPYAESEDVLKFNDLVRFKAVPITKEELYNLLPLGANKDYIKAIEKAIFNKDNNFELSTMEELSEDRYIQFNAFQEGLTTIDPYGEEYRESKALRHRR